MSTKPSQRVRALIVTCGSHGELAHALLFLRAQEFSSDARVLIPAQLYAVHRAALPAAVAPYETLADILAAVDSHQPGLVCLFSVYLLSIDNSLSPDSVDALRHHLRDLGCRVITSDPLLGLGADITWAQVDSRMLPIGGSAWERWLSGLAVRLRGRHAKILRVPNVEEMIHLYPTAGPDRNDGITRLSFFNPVVLRDTSVTDTDLPRDSRDSPPGWLFVLSESDLHVQLVQTGLRDVLENLLAVLRHAIASDKRPTLIAPSLVTERLANVLPAVEFRTCCPFDEFERRVLDAEFMFSWNPFSFSHLARVANERPVFVFDRGCLARAIEPFYELARTCHFGDWEPSCLDERHLFNPYVLAHLAKAQTPAMRALRQRWQTSPTPDELVDQILNDTSLARSTRRRPPREGAT